MLPFGQTVLLWRRQRRMTQEAVAKAARLSRPNLSGIERGKREVSLTTLRALGAVLGVRPGVLVDGIAPGPGEGAPALSRETVERIADAVAFDRPLADPAERATAAALRILLRQRIRMARHTGGPPRAAGQAALRAWIQLRSRYGATAIQALADRVLERQMAKQVVG